MRNHGFPQDHYFPNFLEKSGCQSHPPPEVGARLRRMVHRGRGVLRVRPRSTPSCVRWRKEGRVRAEKGRPEGACAGGENLRSVLGRSSNLRGRSRCSSGWGIFPFRTYKNTYKQPLRSSELQSCNCLQNSGTCMPHTHRAVDDDLRRTVKERMPRSVQRSPGQTLNKTQHKP